MKTIIILSIIIAGFCFSFPDESSLRGLWDQWKLKYQKEYEDENIDAYRFKIFVSNYLFIQNYNLNPRNTAVLGLNQYSDLTSEEFGAIMKGSQPEFEGSDDLSDELEMGVGDFPPSWDWRIEGGVLPITINQGMCASDWALATVASLESLYFIEGHPLTALSPQQLVDCMSTGCMGGFPSQGLQYVIKNGIETLADYPYTGTVGKCKYDASKAINVTSGIGKVISRSANALKQAIYEQPVIVMIEADQAVFQFYTGGVITSGCGTLLNHAVTAIGYGPFQGQDAFIVRNTWGPSFGLNGYVYISTSEEYNNGLGACGILSQGIYPTKN